MLLRPEDRRESPDFVLCNVQNNRLIQLNSILAISLGPIVSGFAIQANNWRWAFWIMLWLSGGALLFLAISMPEVSPPHVNSFDSKLTLKVRHFHRLRLKTSSTDELPDFEH